MHFLCTFKASRYKVVSRTEYECRLYLTPNQTKLYLTAQNKQTHTSPPPPSRTRRQHIHSFGQFESLLCLVHASLCLRQPSMVSCQLTIPLSLFPVYTNVLRIVLLTDIAGIVQGMTFFFCQFSGYPRPYSIYRFYEKKLV